MWEAGTRRRGRAGVADSGSRFIRRGHAVEALEERLLLTAF